MAARPSRLPWVLLACTTVLAFGGPFLIWAFVRGGEHRAWPPDRPIEWWALFAVIGVFSALLVTCIGVAAAQLRRLRGADSAAMNENGLHRASASADRSATAPAAGVLDLHPDRADRPVVENDPRP